MIFVEFYAYNEYCAIKKLKFDFILMNKIMNKEYF